MYKMLHQITKMVQGRGYLANVLKLAGGTAAAQLLVILVSPLLTRLFTPNDFGLLAAYTSILSLFVVVASLRYEIAIPLPKKDVNAANLLILSLLIVITITILMGVVIWAFYDQLYRRFHFPTFFYWLMPLSFLGAGVYKVLNYWSLRKRNFGILARTKFNQSLGLSLTQVSSGIFHSGAIGLMLGDVVGRFGGSGSLAINIWKNDWKILEKVTLTGIRKVAYRYRRFLLLSSGSSLLNSAGVQITPLLLISLYDSQVAGWYALGQRVISLPMVLIGQSVSQAYFSEIALMIRDNPQALRGIYLKTAKNLFRIGVIPIVILIIFGPLLFAKVFGPSWEEAGRYVQILGGMFLVQFVVVPLSQTLNVCERQDLQLAWDAGRLILVSFALICPYFLHQSAEWAIISYSIAMFVAYIILFFLSYKVIRV